MNIRQRWGMYIHVSLSDCDSIEGFFQSHEREAADELFDSLEKQDPEQFVAMQKKQTFDFLDNEVNKALKGLKLYDVRVIQPQSSAALFEKKDAEGDANAETTEPAGPSAEIVENQNVDEML